MAMDNNVTLVGNATRDPELRFTPSGQAVATFGLAVNRRWQNRQTQEWEEQVGFFDVTCWGQFAENVAETIQKGMRCIVTGRLDYRTWEKDGEKKSKIEISADSIGPDLKWATAGVQRNERDSGDFQGGQQQSRGGGRSSGRSSSRSAFENDEEPF